MVKVQVTIPKDEDNQKFELVPEGERCLQVTDIIEKDNDIVLVKCEDILTDGATLLYRVTLNPDDKYFWLTKLFLKCISEPCEGDVVIDTDNWQARQFYCVVRHKDGYANVKRLIYKDIVNKNVKKEEDNIEWEE